MFTDSYLQQSQFANLYSASSDDDAAYLSRPPDTPKERCEDSLKIERIWYWQNLRFRVMAVMCSLALLVNGVLVAFERHLLEYKWFVSFNAACYLMMLLAGAAALLFGLGYIWASHKESRLKCSCSAHQRW